MAEPENAIFRFTPAPTWFGGHLVAHRGFIANRTSLGAEARARGIALLDGSDAELFAFAAATWGPQLVRHVLGEYAAVVADPNTGSFIAAHDALGVVPLFYGWRDQRTLVLATHLEDICGPHLHDLDEEYIADFLALGKQLGPRTPYRNIKRLLVGETLTGHRSRARVVRVWDFAEIKPIRYRDHRGYEEQLRELLDRAVRTAADGVGKVGCELSGGLDSSTVAAMSHRAGIPLELLSVVYPRSRSADERKWMRAFLAEHALPWHTIDGDAHPPFSELPDSFQAEPHAAWPAHGLYRAYDAELSRLDVKVLMTGVGGDHVFCGDSTPPHYLADLLRTFRLNALFDALKAWREADPQDRSLTYYGWRNAVKPLWDWARRHALEDGIRPGPPPWINPDYGRRMRLHERGNKSWVPRCDSVGAQMLAESISWICLTAANRDQLAAGYSFRHPLLYRPLVEFMCAVPWEAKLRPDRDRLLQRRALEDVLPTAISTRYDKRGPAESYFRGYADATELQCLISRQPRVVHRGYILPGAWQNGLAQARYGRAHSMPHFLSAVIMELWLRNLEGRFAAAQQPGSTGQQAAVARNARPEVSALPGKDR